MSEVEHGAYTFQRHSHSALYNGTMTKPQLVDDLVPLILESRDDWTSREFARLALISPCFTHYVRKRLYALPSLRTLNSCELLGRTLRENPALAELVKGVELRPAHDPEARTTGEQFQAIQLLLGLEGLEQLTLGGLLSIRAERFLNAVAFPESIVRLEVEGDGESCALSRDGSLELDDDFWYRFCSVKQLKLGNLRVDVNYTPKQDYQIPIKHAILIQCDVSLCDLLAGSCLDLLCVHADCSCEHHNDLQEILQASDLGHPKALRYTLGKGCRDSDGSFLAQPSGSTQQSTLRSLHLDGHFIEQDFLETLAQYPSLEELVVSGRSVRISSEEWAHLITSGGLPNLQRLQLPGGTSRPPYTRWAPEEVNDLQQHCSSRRIHLD